jgi:DMSO/TMAO reductase YedYZ molybdopterin-dependent catalytic subunit
MLPDSTLEELARNGLDLPERAARIPRQTAPDNAEFPLHQWWSWITPNHLFYRRNHFPIPALDPTAYRLEVDGEVEQARSLSLTDLAALPRRHVVATLVCAGNRRTEFEPKPPGVPWQDGAVSNAEWEGVALTDVLSLAAPRARAVELLLAGADQGQVAGQDAPVRFERSLPLASLENVLLVDRMNGAPLPLEHGAPLRVVVPGAFGMDSVKWLVRLRLLDRPFEGYFQKADYRLFLPLPSTAPGEPIGPLRTSALIAWPAPGTALGVGERVRVVGYAWTGSGAIRSVAISADGGERWLPARLLGPEAPAAWRLWETEWQPSAAGTYRLAARAVDSEGGSQPDEAEWNLKGYANNGLHRVEVTVR